MKERTMTTRHFLSLTPAEVEDLNDAINDRIERLTGYLNEMPDMTDEDREMWTEEKARLEKIQTRM
jgi:hypothetical protein